MSNILLWWCIIVDICKAVRRMELACALAISMSLSRRTSDVVNKISCRRHNILPLTIVRDRLGISKMMIMMNQITVILLIHTSRWLFNEIDNELRWSVTVEYSSRISHYMDTKLVDYYSSRLTRAYRIVVLSRRHMWYRGCICQSWCGRQKRQPWSQCRFLDSSRKHRICSIETRFIDAHWVEVSFDMLHRAQRKCKTARSNFSLTRQRSTRPFYSFENPSLSYRINCCRIDWSVVDVEASRWKIIRRHQKWSTRFDDFLGSNF